MISKSFFYCMSNKKCGIYCIENKINGKKYIGQSIDIARRWTEHRQKSRFDRGTFLYNSFKKYGVKNFDFYIIEECKEEELNDREIYWISHYDTYKHGYNMTLGGAGTVGEKTESQNVLPKNFSKIHGDITDVVKIAKLDTDFNILEVYKSVQDCARKNNIIATNISKTANQKHKTCEGFIYLRYDDIKDMNKSNIADYIKSLRDKWAFHSENPLKRRQVVLIDDNENTVSVFSGVTEAANVLGLDNSSISKVCRGKLKTTKGFRFKYVM